VTARSEIIEKSLSCLDLGIASLIPGIGIVFSIMAFARFRFVVVETNDRWNPARLHLYVGVTLAALTLLVRAVVVTVAYLNVLRAAGEI
jgi:hypothetical protein